MRNPLQTIGAASLLLHMTQSVAASATEMIQSMDSTLPVVAAETTADSSSDDNTFRLGQVVEIAEGTFVGMTGVVKEIDADKGTVKVEVVVFGRPTPVEVPYSQLKR
jgi:transcription antitermination factor NusG